MNLHTSHTVTGRSASSARNDKAKENVMAFPTAALLGKFMPLVLILLTLERPTCMRVSRKYATMASNRQTEKEVISPLNITVNLRNVIRSRTPEVMHDINERSLSPWDISEDEDADRLPTSAPEATCRPIGCVDSEGRGYRSLISAPIHQHMLFLRRKLKGGQLIFTLEDKMVTVGCTCVKQPYV